MKPYIYLFTFLALVGCSQNEESERPKLEEAIRGYFTDMAFKENKPIEIFTLKAVRYRRIGQNQVDSMNRIYYSKLSNKHLAISHEQSTRAKLLLDAGLSRRADEPIRDMQVSLKQARYYNSQDSLLGVRIKANTKNPLDYYLATTFIKMTVGKENVLDTLNMIIDKQYKVVDINKE